MADEIIYKDLFHKTVSLDEAMNDRDGYFKCYCRAGKLKRIDACNFDGRIYEYTYYSDKNENFEEILATAESICDSATIYFNEQTESKYSIWDRWIYLKNDIVEKAKAVFDERNREIAEQILDINSLEVKKTTKKHYLNRLGPFIDDDTVINFGTLEFYYDYPYLSDKKIEVRINLPGYDHKPYYITPDKNVLLEKNRILNVFSWYDNPYYHSREPLVPDL